MRGQKMFSPTVQQLREREWFHALWRIHDEINSLAQISRINTNKIFQRLIVVYMSHDSGGTSQASMLIGWCTILVSCHHSKLLLLAFVYGLISRAVRGWLGHRRDKSYHISVLAAFSFISIDLVFSRGMMMRAARCMQNTSRKNLNNTTIRI